MPLLVTLTVGVPVVLLTVADAVIVGVAPVAPVSPLGPCSPWGPLGPVSPFCPFKFLKAKLNTFAVFAPDAVIVTDGLPTLASTVAVGVPNPAAAPVSPLGPWGPLILILVGLVNPPSFVQDITPAVETEGVNVVPLGPVGPVSPFGPVAPVSPLSPLGPVAPVAPFNWWKVKVDVVSLLVTVTLGVPTVLISLPAAAVTFFI